MRRKLVNNILRKTKFFKEMEYSEYYNIHDKIRDLFENSPDEDEYVSIPLTYLYFMFDNKINCTDLNNDEFLKIFLNLLSEDNLFLDNIKLSENTDEIMVKKHNIDTKIKKEVIESIPNVWNQFIIFYNNVIILHYLKKLETYNIYPNLLTGFNKLYFTNDGNLKLLDFDELSIFNYLDEEKESLIINLLIPLRNQVLKSSVANITSNLPFSNPFKKILNDELYINKEYFNTVQFFCDVEILGINSFNLIKNTLPKQISEYIYGNYYINKYKTFLSSENIEILPYLREDENNYIFKINPDIQKTSISRKEVVNLNNLFENEFSNKDIIYFNKILNVNNIYKLDNKIVSYYPESTIQYNDSIDIKQNLEIIFGIDK